MRGVPDHSYNKPTVSPTRIHPTAYEYAVYCRMCVWCAGPYQCRIQAEEWAIRHEVNTAGH